VDKLHFKTMIQNKNTKNNSEQTNNINNINKKESDVRKSDQVTQEIKSIIHNNTQIIQPIDKEELEPSEENSHSISDKMSIDSNSKYEIHETNDLFKDAPINININLNASTLTTKSISNNLNEHITSKLNKMLDYQIAEGNKHKSVAYRNAISQIRAFHEKITSFDQIKNIKYIGKHIGRKIREILLTGDLKKTTYICNDKRNKIVRLFQGVYGVGVKLAQTLYTKGLRNINDLRKHQGLLNSTQKIGLKYYDDLIQRIPRKESEDIFNEVKTQLLKILPEEFIRIELCGSYRRGKPSSGDVDILITRLDKGGVEGIMDSLLENLLKIGLIKESISDSHSDKIRYQFTGVCKLDNNPHRQIDIKIYHKDYYAFALLFFTGSAHFNRELRFHANQNGYNLTDMSLENVHEYTRKKYSTGEFIRCNSEEDIFEALGLPYKYPNERDV
jgi:DNA polymerase lambda